MTDTDNKTWGHLFPLKPHSKLWDPAHWVVPRSVFQTSHHIPYMYLPTPPPKSWPKLASYLPSTTTLSFMYFPTHHQPSF